MYAQNRRPAEQYLAHLVIDYCFSFGEVIKTAIIHMDPGHSSLHTERGWHLHLEQWHSNQAKHYQHYQAHLRKWRLFVGM